MTHLTEIITDVHETSVAHGFWPDGKRNFGEAIALVTSEYSEALDENRSGNPDIWIDEKGKPQGELIELIDGVIRTFDLIGEKDKKYEGEIPVYDADKNEIVGYVNLDAAFAMKADYNKGRPQLHGRKY